ncbi:MAG: hypothetical protein ACK44A_07225 [Roseateles sp.]
MTKGRRARGREHGGMRGLLIVLALLCGAAQAQQTLAPGVVLVPGGFEAGRQPDGNSLLLQGQGGWVLIDTGRHRAHTEAALAAARALSADGWLDGYRRQLEAALPSAPSAQAEVMRVDLALLQRPGALQPDHEIRAAQALSLAGRRLRVGLETAVSGGDLWVLDEASGTLAAGDLVTLPVPFLDTACPPAWREALARLSAQPFRQLVPGHGPAMSRADFERWRGGFEALLDCAAQGLQPAACAAVWRQRAPGLDEAGAARVGPMLGYYFKALLQAAPEQRERHCRRD